MSQASDMCWDKKRGGDQGKCKQRRTQTDVKERERDREEQGSADGPALSNRSLL